MEFKEFSNNYELNINDEDIMFDIAADIFSEHSKSKQTIFDVEHQLQQLEKGAPEIYLDKELYPHADASLLVIAEIFATIKTDGKISNYGSDDENDYISSKQLIFNKTNLEILLKKLTQLFNAPADEHDIFETFSDGKNDKDPYFMSVIGMYIDMLTSEIIAQ